MVPIEEINWYPFRKLAGPLLGNSAFYKEKFEKGMSCKYGADIDDIVHVSLTDDGIQIKISDSAKDTENKNELELIGHLVRAMSQSSLISYYEAMGYLPREKSQTNFDPKGR